MARRVLRISLLFFLFVSLVQSNFLSPGTVALSAEKRLIKDLVDTYKQAGLVGRPVRNSSDPISVKYGLALVQILSLDEKNQVLTISAWNRFEWNDYLLSWNVSDYDGIDSVRIPPTDIWRPDIVLYNYADDRLEEFRHAYAVVSHDGTVTWIPRSIYKSSCSIDITNFPFDSQICKLKFSSWTYNAFKLDLFFYQDLPEISLNDYVPSNEWDLIGHPAQKNVIYYPCCIEPFPDLTFTLVLKRQVAFYSYILILPCVLLSLLTMVLFWLPPESPAKMQLGMNIFVAFFLLLLLLTDNTPPAASAIPLIGMNIFVAFFVLLLLLADSTPPAASNIPLIGAYYCLNMIMITVSTFLVVIIIHLYFRGPRTNRVPPWIKRVILDVVARCLCMTNYVPRKEKPQQDYEAVKTTDPNKINKDHYRRIKMHEMKYNKFQPPREVDQLAFQNSTNHVRNNNSLKDRERDMPSPDRSPLHMYPGIDSDIREIRKFIRTLVYKQKAEEELDKIKGEWRAVALVLDRLFFVIYSIAIVISLGTMFPRGK